MHSQDSTAAPRIGRRTFLAGACGTWLGAGMARSVASAPAKPQEGRPPNIVLILTDDQGYGDLGCYGGQQLRTPRIDEMAAEGMRFTSFYAAAPICTPTRASIMTGCYAPRVGLSTPLHTPDPIGLNPDEVTLPELLKDAGYATGCIGKWHLGHEPPFYPTRHGFDYYYGTPLGHFFADPARGEEESDLFLRNEKAIPFPPHEELTEDLTAEALAFIKANKDRPFFLFLSHPMPHTPLAVPERFRGKSGAGRYGDVIYGIDWSTGRVLDTLKALGLDESTYVVFTSDNGPEHEDASAGPLRGGKHSAYEGGFRVPCVMRGPRKVPAGTVCNGLATTMDFYATFAALAGVPLPKDTIVDGKDIRPMMQDPDEASPYDEFFYFIRHGRLAGIRRGKWKLLVEVETGPWSHEGVTLYDLEVDLGETTNLAEKHPALVRSLRERMQAFEQDLEANSRPPGRV